MQRSAFRKMAGSYAAVPRISRRTLARSASVEPPAMPPCSG
jgi:hypothetical protein